MATPVKSTQGTSRGTSTVLGKGTTLKKRPKVVLKNGLNPKQQMFCMYYTGELFGNGTMSYAAAYQIDLESFSREPERDADGKVVEVSEYQKKYMGCMVSASQLLRNFKVKKRVETLMDAKFNDKAVDRRHAELIFGEDNNVSLGAIREFNRVKGRVKDKDDIPPGAAPITKIEIVMPKV